MILICNEERNTKKKRIQIDWDLKKHTVFANCGYLSYCVVMQDTTGSDNKLDNGHTAIILGQFAHTLRFAILAVSRHPDYIVRPNFCSITSLKKNSARYLVDSSIRSATPRKY